MRCEVLFGSLPQLDTCCCCCKVKTGSKVIAWCRAVGALLSTISSIITLVIEIEGSASDKNTTAAIVAYIIVVLYTAFVCIMALLLLFGIYQEDMRKVKVWLGVSISMFYLMIALMTFLVVSFAIRGYEVAAVVIISVFETIYILCELYIMSIVKSHYHNMQNGFKGRA